MTQRRKRISSENLVASFMNKNMLNRLRSRSVAAFYFSTLLTPSVCIQNARIAFLLFFSSLEFIYKNCKTEISINEVASIIADDSVIVYDAGPVPSPRRNENRKQEINLLR